MMLRCPRILRFFLYIIPFLFFHKIAAQSQQQLECPPGVNQTYEWQSLDYYKLLGLKRNQRNLNTKDIRKAYRKQAQLWHPDKQANNNGTKTFMDECTARFTRIAEAYETLDDPEQRKEYNSFLKQCEKSASKTSRWPFRLDTFADSLQVFEEFFFGANDFGYYEQQQQQQHQHQQQQKDAYSNFGNSYNSNARQQTTNDTPIRTFKDQEVVQDTFTGEEIVRILQTEEFAATDPATGKFYYRVYAQEFKKTFDPFTGMSYVPVSQPYLREEGYRYTSSEEQKQQQQRDLTPAQTILFPGDILTPRSTLLVSPNKRYYAGISPECELLVMADNGRQADDLIWSSQTLNKMFPTKPCFATLRGPHLVIGMERPGLPHQILWFSEAGEEEDEDYLYMQRKQQHSTYLAQLDNDGSLVVYKVWNVPRQTQSLPELAWIAASNLWRGQTRAEYDVLYSPFSVTYRKCVYATGPMGCFRVARRLYELSLTIYYTIKGIISEVDNKMDTFMDLVLEEDDFVRAMKGSLWNNGASIGSKSARFVRRLMQLFLVREK
jgi:curved DNA-binding protein CbpA